MSSYLSNLLTSTTDKYNTLRRTLLTSETDGDTEDDSHITRVLRAYYVEKSRTLPPWLPPDPKRPSISAASAQPQPSTRPGYGNMSYTSTSSQRSALSDLWDTTPPSQPQPQPTSLRPGRQNLPSSATTPHLAPNPRPLPSQRAGSYQSQMTRRQPDSAAALQQQDTGGSTGSAGGGGTAQERLKARLWGQAGARAGSPGYGASGQQQQQGGGAGSSPYEGRGGGVGGGGRAGSPYDRQGGGSSYDARGGGSPYDARGGGSPYDRQQGGGNPYDRQQGGGNPYDRQQGGQGGGNPYERHGGGGRWG
ncbi:hypothetical protein ANO11243_017560 [Dothideomycetidae sp. 11243]|nr:hypothetical protein ANO11243_017560 [fungal sp. No.11243]